MAEIIIQDSSESNSQTIRNSQPDSSNIDSFIKEIASPTEQALGVKEGPEVKYQQPAAQAQESADAEPVVKPGETYFKPEDVQQEGSGKPNEAEGSKRPSWVPSEDYKQKTVRYYIDMGDEGLAWLGCLLTGTKDKSYFKFSAAYKEMLLHALEPYMDTIIGALPKWVPVVLIMGAGLADWGKKVIDLKKINKANAAGKKDVGKMSQIADAVNNAERSSYVIFKDGYYRNDRTGGYIKRDGSNNDKLERPSFDDIEKILAIPSNKSISLLCLALDLKPEDFEANGIDTTGWAA